MIERYLVPTRHLLGTRIRELTNVPIAGTRRVAGNSLGYPFLLEPLVEECLGQR